ncbi:MAG: hypothetical protein ACREI7_09265 [Myxococcota bacterium]
MTVRIDDPSGRVSEELSQVLEDALADAGDEPVTMGMARDKLKQTLAEQGRAASRTIGAEQTLYAELEALVEEFGKDAPVIDFVAVKASDELSELIEEVLDQTAGEQGVTLGRVRETIEQGLTAELEGEGTFESDVEQPLLAELDALIERYGPDTPAEDVLRFD